MHTCFLVSQFIPPRHRSRYGAPTLCYHLATRLSREIEVTVVTNLFPRGFVTNLEGIDVYSARNKLPYYGGFKADMLAAFDSIKEIPFLLQFLKHLDPDIIHVYGDITASFLASICKSLRKPVIMTLTSPFSVHRFFSPDLRFFRSTRTMSSIALRTIDKVICMSRHMKGYLSKHLSLDKNKISVVPHGISDNFLHQNSSSKLESCIEETKSGNMILFWGEGTYNRGFHVFVKSVPHIMKEETDISFFVVVRRFDNSCLNLMKKYRNAAKFIVMNEREGPYNWPITDVVASADIVTLPFIVNPMEPPLTLVESMAAGRAVITSNVGGNKETVRHMTSGILVKKGDEKQLAEHSLRLIRDEKYRKEMGINARRSVLQKYRWDICVKDIMHVYERAMRP